MAPPRTRRSTSRAVGNHQAETGSSAHAEIDLSMEKPTDSEVRLLRARGDRPIQDASIEQKGLAPPRTRRSTRVYPARAGIVSGSSAHAEIDLSTWYRRWDGKRLLRARGDRPNPRVCRSQGRLAPPRTRRSTL